MQGLALVVIATVSTTLTSPHGLGLSDERYGTLFIPQSILAVICSLAGGAVLQRLGARRTLLIGFAANVLAMLAIASTALLVHDRFGAYAVLLCATSFLGIGFSFVAPTLNVLAAQAEPAHADRAGLIVNALLGGSAAVAPLLFIVFVSIGRWWALPLLCAIGMLALMCAVTRIRFERQTTRDARTRSALPNRVWVFAAFAFVYGLCEQIDGSWAPLYMTHRLGAAAVYGSAALAMFWAASTIARVGFALATKTSPTVVFRALPFVVAGSFVVLASLQSHASPIVGVAAFALAGLGISALLPLVLSLGERSMAGVAATATSVVFASYLVGYGIAAFGVGPLEQRGITLSAIDLGGAAIALAAAALAFTIAKISGEPT